MNAPDRIHGQAPWLAPLLFTLALALPASAQAPGDLRVALVIGNAAYTGAAALANPVNDAAAMSATLKGLGFSVLEVKDGTREQMAQAIAQMRQTLAGKKGVGMLYYAGHGLQLDWRNYMVPVDAKLGSAAEVPQQTVDVNSVIDVFKTAGNRMNIVVLDACRDNPFADKGSGKGLAQLDAPPGTFLAYATAPGNVAEDGDAKSANGLYTSFLLQELKKPQARIEDVFKRVRFGVRQASNGRQIPWESTSLEDDFFFDTRAAKVDKPKLGSREEEALFQIEKAAWDRIKDSAKAEDFFAYLQAFPSGFFSEQASFKLNVRAKPTLVASPTQQQAAAGVQGVRLDGGERLRAGDRFELVARDAISKAVSARMRFGVRSLDGDRLTPDDPGGVVQLDAMGGIISDSRGAFDPPLVVLPSEFVAGKTWGGRTQWTNDYGRNTFSYQSRVVGRERITIDAGTFDAWRIETRALNQRRDMPSGGNAFIMRVWAVPEIGLPLRMMVEGRNTQGLQRSDLIELSRIEVKR